MLRALPVAFMALSLLALPAEPVSAQAPGRVLLHVVDENNEPLQGVTVTITVEGRGFRETATTDRRGRATVVFVDATLTYRFLFEKEGHASFDQVIQPEVAGIVRREIILPSLAAAAPQHSDSEGEATETGDPAIDVFNQGVLAFREGELEEAEEHFQAAVGINPDLAEGYSALAGLLFERGELARAAEAAERLLELEPDSVRAYQILHDAYEALGEEARAAEALEALSRLEAGADAAVRVFNQGADAARLGDLQRARERFERAIELDPDLVPAYFALATVQLNQGDLVGAHQNANRALELDPGNLNALRVRWVASRDMGDSEGAQRDLAVLTEKDRPWVVRTFAEEGRHLFNAGEAGAARQAYERVLEVDPDHPQAHYMLGLIHVQGDTARARTYLRRFLELAPDDPEASAAREMLRLLD